MKPSEKQNLDREKEKQTMKKQSIAWTKLTEEKTYETGPDGEIIDTEAYKKQTDEIQAALAVIRMFPTQSRKDRKHEERKRKLKNERRERKAKRRRATDRAKEYKERTSRKTQS